MLRRRERERLGSTSALATAPTRSAHTHPDVAIFNTMLSFAGTLILKDAANSSPAEDVPERTTLCQPASASLGTTISLDTDSAEGETVKDSNNCGSEYIHTE